MVTLPQLIEEDVQQLDATLEELLEQTDATTALIIDKAVFSSPTVAISGNFDLTTIAALASGAYLANQTIANLIQRNQFIAFINRETSTACSSCAWTNVCLLTVIFKGAPERRSGQILCPPGHPTCGSATGVS